ncbi:MAG: PilZ domain-containing protein [Candidatus Methylomirabilales bacterium]
MGTLTERPGIREGRGEKEMTLVVRPAPSEIADSDRRVGGRKKWLIPRRHPRFFVPGKTTGRVTPDYEASLINISLGGVLIEHTQVVQPGTIAYLDIPLLGRGLRLQCRVVRSVVNRPEQEADGERVLIYHTGLEFLDLPEETRQLIGDYIHSITEDEKPMPTDDVPVRRWYTCEKCDTSFELTDSEVRPAFIESLKRPVQTGDLFHYDHGTCQGTLMYTLGGPFLPWSVNEEPQSS